MNSTREAKKILKAFGKEAYNERIKYVDSFMPEQSSYVKSANYRFRLRRTVMVAIMVVLIMALAVSVYAAVMYYLNYTKTEHLGNDEYSPQNQEPALNSESIFYEPTIIPEGYELKSVETNDIFKDKKWIYRGQENKQIVIWQGTERSVFYIDNEHSNSQTIMIGSIEAIIYDHENEITGLMQYEDTVITVTGPISLTEFENIVRGLNLPD